MRSSSYWKDDDQEIATNHLTTQGSRRYRQTVIADGSGHHSHVTHRLSKIGTPRDYSGAARLGLWQANEEAAQNHCFKGKHILEVYVRRSGTSETTHIKSIILFHVPTVYIHLHIHGSTSGSDDNASGSFMTSRRRHRDPGPTADRPGQRSLYVIKLVTVMMSAVRSSACV